MLRRDVAVIEAAETLVQKWREFDNNGQAEDPEDYAEALIRAVSARKADLKPTTAADHPTPSITVGTQVRLTGVVVAVFSDGAAAVEFKGGGITTGMKPQEMKHAEVIRQPFKRGEVVWFTGPLIGDGDDGLRVVVADEAAGNVLIVAPYDEAMAYLCNAEDYERRPSRPKEER